MDTVIGIDLGTTSSRVAIMDGGSPVIIENSEGEGTTPSYVALTTNGTRLVGESARRYSLGNPQRVIFAVKRLIGRRYVDPMVQELRRFMPFQIIKSANGDAWVRVDDIDYAPEQITAFILQKMKKTAEDYLGEAVGKAVITVPAYFNDQQRLSTRNAARIAGLEVLRLESEPTMAALAYGLRKREGQVIAVFDLGGGTFDISILEIGDGVFEVKSTSGDMFLGGEDFDFRIMEHLATVFRATYDVDLMTDPIARQRLKQAAETAKIDLSSRQTASIDLPFIYSTGKGAFHFHTEITRATFDSLIGDLIARSLEVCSRALKDAGLSPSEINQIVLVGGSTRIPYVKQQLHKYFGRQPYGGLRREDAVALGAAISAGVLNGLVKDALLLDVTPLSLGIETRGGVFASIIDRNTTFPTKRSRIFSNVEDGQTALAIRIYQGDQGTTSENKLLGQLDLIDITPGPRATARIEVTFDIDANGIVHVSAKDLATQKEQSVRLSASGGLSDRDIDSLIADAQRVGISELDPASPISVGEKIFKAERAETVEPPPAVASPKAAVRSLAERSVPQIFLSYAHEDEKWALEIRKSLSVLTRSNKAKVWSDHKIEPGTEWENRIYNEIEQSNIAILLLSNDFLNSDFILAKELPAIFAEKERRRLVLIPIVARPCAFDLHDELSKFQLFNKPEAPLSSLDDWQVEAELVRLTRHMANAVS